MNALGKPQWAPLGRIYVVKSDEKRRVNGRDFAPSGLNLLMSPNPWRYPGLSHWASLGPDTASVQLG